MDATTGEMKLHHLHEVYINGWKERQKCSVNFECIFSIKGSLTDAVGINRALSLELSWSLFKEIFQEEWIDSVWWVKSKVNLNFFLCKNGKKIKL